METIENFTPEVIERLIVQVAFFNNFTETERKHVLKYMDAFLRFKPQENILEEGCVDDRAMYVLLSGQVSVEVGEKHAHVNEVAVGDIFGEISFLTSLPRTATVTAEEASIVWRIDHELLEVSPIEVREKIKDNIVVKLAHSIADSNDMLSRTLP